MKLNKFAATFAALSIFGMGSAQADSFASAVLTITNIKWINNATNLPLVNGGEGTIIGGQNKADASVNLTGFSTLPISDTPSLDTGGQIPFRNTCIGVDCTGTPPNPGPPANVLPNGKTYSYADYSLSGAVVDVPPAIAAGANANSTAQVDLSGKIGNPSAGTSSSNVGSNASFSIKPTNTVSTRFELDYAVHLVANIVGPFGAGDAAKASSKWNLIVRDNADHINFLPPELNFSVATTGANGLSQYNATGKLVSGNFTMDAGEIYSFTISSNVQAEGLRDFVPEPDSLALFGIGAVGLMVSSLRRRKLA
jgi:hypothetical protein